MNNKSHSDLETGFKPTGTIAFLVLLLILTALVWWSVYSLQLERH